MGKGGLWLTSFIYKYKTSTTYPLYETMRCFVLINKSHLWVQSAKPTIRLYPQFGYDLFFIYLFFFKHSPRPASIRHPVFVSPTFVPGYFLFPQINLLCLSIYVALGILSKTIPTYVGTSVFLFVPHSLLPDCKTKEVFSLTYSVELFFEMSNYLACHFQMIRPQHHHYNLHFFRSGGEGSNR